MKITIIGGGITGLTTALSLLKRGIETTVYEQAESLTEVGAGIWIQPNALKIFDWLGLGEKVREAGSILRGVELTDSRLKAIRKADENLISQNLESSSVSIHRAHLQQILFDALPADTVKFGKPIIGYTNQNGQLDIRLQDETIPTNVIIGADGIHSKVRSQLIPETSTRYSGQTCWRGISDIHLPSEFVNKGIEAWGKGIRFGFSQVNADKAYWFAVAKAPQNQKDKPEERQATLCQMFNYFNPLVAAIIAQTPKDAILRNDISDLKRIANWHSKNICLAGDAAHATTPNMGQGACQGIEDAYYLSDFLTKHDNPENAFSAFESARRSKVDYVVNTSWRIGQMAHSTLGQPLMKMLVKYMPESLMQKQMQKLHSIKTN